MAARSRPPVFEPRADWGKLRIVAWLARQRRIRSRGLRPDYFPSRTIEYLPRPRADKITRRITGRGTLQLAHRFILLNYFNDHAQNKTRNITHCASLYRPPEAAYRDTKITPR
jgi:hypothetical protein